MNGADEAMTLTLNTFKFPKGARKSTKRKGRGQSSGVGKTCGRGQKGQNSRSGGGVRPGFEGGQMPLARRLPKRGFHNKFRIEFHPINLVTLADVEAGTKVDMDWLQQKGIVKASTKRVKVLGTGDAPKGVTIRAHKFSRSAQEKIQAAGGTAEVIES